MYYSQVRLMEDHITLPERKGSQKRPAYAGATAQANDPVQNKFFRTKPASANVSSSNGGWAEIRVVIPSAKAQANVRPYVGAHQERANPTPKTVAANAEECLNAIRDRADADSSEASDPFRLTNVAAVVQPKCMINGKRR